MEGLEKYTTEELKAEIKRRNDLAKKEAESVMRCKHCLHFLDKGYGVYRCGIKTWGKKIRYQYAVSKSQRACELFKQNRNCLLCKFCGFNGTIFKKSNKKFEP